MNKLKFFALLTIILALPFFAARAYYSLGKPTGFVTDQANVLSSEQKQALETKLEQFEATSTNEIAIAIIPSLKGDYIENFSVQLFKDWGIGQKGKNNGILILVATQDHQMRIEVGYGLEGALTDAQSSWIINNTLAPALKTNDYYGGLDQATDQIISATRGEFSAADQPSSPSNNNKFQLFEFLFFISWFVLAGLFRLFAKTKSWWLGGVIGGVVGGIGGLIFGGPALGGVLFVILGLLGLLLDFIASKIGPGKGGRGGGWLWFLGGPGGFSGGNSGFGGGGGFGGFGGGGSGGGGASGGW